MKLTPEQVKGRIKNVAKQNDADARTLMRIYSEEDAKRVITEIKDINLEDGVTFEIKDVSNCKKRKTEYLKTDAFRIIASIETDANLKVLWNSYQKKYPYAADKLKRIIAGLGLIRKDFFIWRNF